MTGSEVPCFPPASLSRRVLCYNEPLLGRAMEPSEKYVLVGGIDIHYLEWGESRGIPLVLIHGFLDLAWSWLPFMSSMGEKCWIIAPDCRGHGDSGWVRAGYYHFPDYVADLAGLVGTLQVEKIFLLGHSMGGNVAALFAGTFPARVERLVIVESLDYDKIPPSEMPARMEASIHSRRRRLLSPSKKFTSVEEAAGRLREVHPSLTPEFARFLAEKGTRPLPDGQRAWKFDPLHQTTSPHPYTLKQAQAFWRRIACPVLMINASDSHMGLNYSQPIYDVFRRKTRETIRDSGHMVHREKPDELAGIVRSFLTQRAV